MWLYSVPVLLGILSYICLELLRPELLIVGNITIDLVEDTTPTGGAVSYAAAVARALGVKACIVTVAGPDADLSVFDGHELHVIPSDSTLTFEHTYTWIGNNRRLRVTANPNVTVRWEHVPWRCQLARTVLLGPLTLHDLDAASFIKPAGHAGLWELLARRGQRVGLMAQGFQRKLDREGLVKPLKTPSPQLMAGLGSQVSLFLSDVETGKWPRGTISHVADITARFVVTRGAQGADEHRRGGPKVHIPSVEVPKVVDTNGAGDTFGTAYMIALARGHADPAAFASWAASRAVMVPQSSKPQGAGDQMLRDGKPWTRWDHWQLSGAPGMAALTRGPLAAHAREACLRGDAARVAAAEWLRRVADAATPGVVAAADRARELWGHGVGLVSRHYVPLAGWAQQRAGQASCQLATAWDGLKNSSSPHAARLAAWAGPVQKAVQARCQQLHAAVAQQLRAIEDYTQSVADSYPAARQLLAPAAWLWHRIFLQQESVSTPTVAGGWQQPNDM